MKTQYISSAKNQRVQTAALLRDSKHRRREDRFLIDSWKLIELAARHDIQIEEIFVLDGSPFLGSISELANSQPKLIVSILSAAALSKIQYGEQSQEVIAIAKDFDISLETAATRFFDHAKRVSSRRGLYLVLDRIEKPGNLGAALRTADAVGVNGVILSDPVCDVTNPNVIRSSLGALFCLPIAVATQEEAVDWLRARDVKIFTARVDGSEDYHQIAFPSPLALIVGNEAQGLADRWQSKDFVGVSIPMAGEVDSLNASISTAVLLFEIARQWSMRSY